MKKINKGLLIFNLILSAILLALVPIGSKIGIDIVEKYKFKMENIPKNYIKDVIYNVGTYKNFKLDNPISIALLCLVGYFIFTMLFNSFVKDNKYESSYSYGSHGTSRWQTTNEIKTNFYKDKKGWFLGSLEKTDYKIGMKGAYHAVENKSKLNMQMVVIGPPGSDKTTGFVLPNIFNLVNSYIEKNKIIDDFINKREDTINKYNGITKKVISNVYNIRYKNINLKKEMPDIIITDPKSELYSLTADFLDKSGYEVRVLDFIHQKYGDYLNPIDFIEDDKMLMEIAQGYVDSIGGGGSKSGEQVFWDNQEAQVLAALIGFVKQKYPKERQTLTEVSKILTSEDVADIDSAKEFFKDNNIKGAANQFWNNFLMIADSERTRANILGGLAEKLRVFAIEGIQNLTSKTTIDISSLGRKKDKPIALFILMPDGDRTFSPIINVIITTIFKEAYKTAYKTKNRLEVPLYSILEEMANIGKIPGMQEMLGTMRGRRIYPMMIWQSLSQMKDRYGDKGFEDILSMCDTHVYLGINDQFTSRYCSDDLGYTTIKTKGTSKKENGKVLSVEQNSETYNYTQRKLLLPEECKKFDNDKFILIQRSKNPVKLYKCQYKYWKYCLSEEKSIFDLNKLESGVVYITPEKEESSIKEVKDQIQERENKYKTVENAEIDSDVLSDISDSIDEIEV
ncbi:VirD4-like conjugal transfer protein, CD1115 family [Clostridium botulinum]|uniref:VirD4-like conjugal transfer protein, CD1115 family n=1 Tax=Clostridium botulinum TaxID=1491 RepID=UPI000773B1A8|nr:type IV secretory system conjugative DNA transfer family protein [Clostridium botulinum]